MSSCTTERHPAVMRLRWPGALGGSREAVGEPSGRAAAELQGLLQASAQGDRLAFACLYRLTSSRLYAVIRRSVWHRGEAEELLQELYVRLWHHAADYDAARAQPMAWMSRIARNLALDHLRRQAQRVANERADEPGTEVDEFSGATARCPDPQGGPPELLEARQLGAQARALLAGLQETQRHVLVLTFWQGLSHSEVAEHLELPIGTVKSMIRRSLMALKASIEQGEARRLSTADRARALAALLSRARWAPRGLSAAGA